MRSSNVTSSRTGDGARVWAGTLNQQQRAGGAGELCLTCGHVGCCDSSPMRHARGHAYTVGHPIVQSMEPGEDWRWCYVDENFV